MSKIKITIEADTVEGKLIENYSGEGDVDRIRNAILYEINPDIFVDKGSLIEKAFTQTPVKKGEK